MATTPDPKDIKNAQEALNDYNDKLRDSINLAKMISDNIALLAGGMNKVSEKGRKIVTDLNDYSRSLAKTINLSEKLATGKLKEKEVTDQIASLQNKYNKYLEDSNKRGSYIKENLKAQRTLQREVNESLAKSESLGTRIADQYKVFERQQEDLAQATADYYNANNIQEKQRAAQRMKNIREELADTNITLNFLEKQQSVEEKILNSKKQELDRVKTINDAHKDLKKQYEKEIQDNKAILAALKEQKSFAKEFKEELSGIGKKSLDTLKSYVSLTTVFETLKKVAFAVSDQVTKLQKGLVLSRDEAYDLRQEFNNIAVASEDAAINTNRLVEANAQLGKQLGFNSKFTADMNIQFVKLTKQIGLSEEAAGGLAKLSKATGMTLQTTKNVALETSQRLSAQYGIQLDQREVLEEIGKISGQTLAMFKANPKALAEAVAQAKLLGTNLETTRKQASALLDFESSIENELQAELLTGQALNLERARSAALMGDMTTVMKELNNQNVDFNKFSNMNVIAQDKLATSLGLSSDELSDQLLKQQYMNKSREEVAALAGEEVANRLEALNAQDKFNLAVEKMQDMIGTIAGGPLGKLVDMFASLANNSTVLYTTLGLIAGISFTKLVVGLAASAVQAGLLAAGTAASASAITLGIGAVAIVAGIAAMMAAYNSAKEDATQPVGDMFSAGGKTTVSTKEGGLFSLSDNDQLAAAPGLGDMLSRPTQTVVAQDNSEMLNKFDALIAKMENVSSGINQLGKKDVTIKANTQVMGTAQLMGNTNLA
jgi:hypothetical protein